MSDRYSRMKVNQGVADLDDKTVDFAFGFRHDHGGLPTEAIGRIFDYARLILNHSPFDREDMWATSLEGCHSPMVKLISNGDRVGFASLMSSVATTPLVKGFMNYFSYEQLSGSQVARRLEATQFMDKALSLLGFLGISKVYCPEQGGLDVGFFGERLVEAFKVNEGRLEPPGAGGGAYGFVSQLGVVTLKDVKSLATAYKIQDVIKNFPCQRICEIGGGLGFLSYYASKLSRTDYFLYDVPTVSIMQAYFLMRSLGPENVSLAGEESSRASVHLRPFWSIFEQDGNSTLWVNQDSLPEIDPNISLKYLEHMSKFASAGFLSINQEAAADNLVGGRQGVVPKLIATYDSSFRRVWRSRDFLRAGYVEEFYRIN
ncbi:MAG: hypothetical protein ACK52I_23170 [Pseudomonadota bacterium]|jgi:hypothetical protein